MEGGPDLLWRRVDPSRVAPWLHNRGELLLSHRHDGMDLKGDYARETLKNLATLWRRPVNLSTKVEGRGMLLRHDGQAFTEKRTELQDRTA